MPLSPPYHMYEFIRKETPMRTIKIVKQIQYTKAFILVGALLTTTACNVTTSTSPSEGIAFREARFTEISIMREYRSCHKDAMELDGKARKEGSFAKYIASAKLLDACEENIGQEVAGVAVEERMRAYALSIQNYLKGGDIVKAKTNLGRFEKAFSGSDLYYPDGSSFTDTMHLLLGLKKRSTRGELAMSNVSKSLKSELRRINYWTRN